MLSSAEWTHLRKVSLGAVNEANRERLDELHTLMLNIYWLEDCELGFVVLSATGVVPPVFTACLEMLSTLVPRPDGRFSAKLQYSSALA